MHSSKPSRRTTDLAINPVISEGLRRHQPLDPEAEHAVALAIWLAREEAWSLVLADPTARSRAVAVIEAADRADVPDDAAPRFAKDRRALLDALSIGDTHAIAVADKDDTVLRLAVREIAEHLAGRARSCLVRLDAAVRTMEKHNLALVYAVIKAHFGALTGRTADPRARTKQGGKGPRPFLAGEIEADDLLAWGTIGLRTAVLRFDVRRDLKFSTFAFYWIRHQIGREMVNTRHRVRLPVHVAEDVRKVQAATARLRAAGQTIDNESLAAATGLTLKKVKAVNEAMRVNYGPSLSDQRGDPDGDTIEFGELLADDAAMGGDDVAEALDVGRKVAAAKRAMATLPTDDAFILECRLGLGRGDRVDCDGDSLKDVAEVLECSREWVRRKELAALAKVRRMVAADLERPGASA